MGIKARHINKDFSHQRVLHDVSLEIQNGEFVSISGKSGSGKSTLLYILSTLDTPSSGEVIIDNLNTITASQREVDQFRAHQIGFIFQFHYLLPELTSLENILLPARNLKQDKEKRDQALSLLNKLEILDQKDKLPSQMSGGQQQRVAIARALLMKPQYIFADEPTGNLDTTNADKVMDLLSEINETIKTTIILVTHEPEYSKRAKREILLVDGRVQT